MFCQIALRFQPRGPRGKEVPFSYRLVQQQSLLPFGGQGLTLGRLVQKQSPVKIQATARHIRIA